MKNLRKLKAAGFTLVEVIITIIVIAIVGAMIVSTLGLSMSHSSDPIFRMQTSFSLQQVMENFITVYEKYYAGDLDGLKTEIGAEEPNPSYDNKYGKYTIIENHYIKFDGNVEKAAETNDTHDLLKVTIKNSNNETLTYIFVG